MTFEEWVEKSMPEPVQKDYSKYKWKGHGEVEMKYGVDIMRTMYNPVDMDREFIEQVVKKGDESDEELIGGLMDLVIRLCDKLDYGADSDMFGVNYAIKFRNQELKIYRQGKALEAAYKLIDELNEEIDELSSKDKHH